MQVSLLLDVEKIEFWMRIQEDEFMIFGVVLNYLLNKCLVGEDLVVNLIVSEIWYTHQRLDRDRGLFFFFLQTMHAIGAPFWSTRRGRKNHN